MPKKTTLTSRQWEIVNLMRDGWELRKPVGRPLRLKLKNGNMIKAVNWNTFNSLWDKAIIAYIPTDIWQLTELGKTLTREE